MHICIRVSCFLRCLVGSSCAHYQNNMETKKKNIWRLFGRESMGKSQKNKTHLRKPTKNNIWRLFGKESSINKIKKPRENQKKQKTKTFQWMFGLRLMFGFFGFCLGFFVFFWSWPGEKKKTQGFFGFLDKIMVKELCKTKKTQVFFWFFIAQPKRN